MFSDFMMNTWIVATAVAVVSGVVGFFVVLRGAAFVAHALPQTGFAGAAGASLVGTSTLLGLGVFSAVAALGIALLGRRGRSDVVTALALVLMLGTGALFLGFGGAYAPEVYSLVFGEVLGVASSELLPVALLGAAAVVAVLVLYRPLVLASLAPELAGARGVPSGRVEIAFLLVVALVTTMSVPVVGALLVFSLLVGPPAAARAVASGPLRAIVVSVVLALATVWVAIAASYLSNWPIGFFVGIGGAFWYLAVRVFVAVARRPARDGVARRAAIPAATPPA